MTKIAGSDLHPDPDPKSGSISQRHGSADPDPDPDPHQNVVDPQHWCLEIEKAYHLYCGNLNFIVYTRRSTVVSYCPTPASYLSEWRAPPSTSPANPRPRFVY
jgi:hypothetical protein